MATSRKVTLFFAAENFNAVLGWLAIMLVARKLGAGTLGELAFALSLVGSFTVLVIPGFLMAHIKRVSEGQDLGRCIGTFAVIRLVTVTFMVFGFGLAWWVWTGPLGKGFYDLPPGILPTILAYQVIFLLVGIMTATYTGLQQTARTVVPNALATALRSLVMIAAALTGAGVIWLARAYLLGIVLAALLGLWYFRDYPVSRPDRATWLSYKRYTLPLVALSVFGVLQQFADKLLIGIFWTEKEVGLYFGVQRIALLIGTMALALEGLLLPAASELHAHGGSLRELVHRAERYVAMVALPLVVATAVLAKGIIVVFLSREFLPATAILQLLTLAALVYVLNRPWSVALRGADRPDLIAALGISTGLLNLLLMLLLVPREIPHLGLYGLPGLGGEGAALALLATWLCNAVVLRWLCRRHLGVSPAPRLLLQLAAALGMTAALWMVAETFAVDRWFELLAAAGLGGLLYLLLLAGLREFNHHDLAFFRDAFNPGGMKDYLKAELRR